MTSSVRVLDPCTSPRDQLSDILADRHPRAVLWAQQFVQWRQQRLDRDGYDMAGDEEAMFTWFAAVLAAEADRPTHAPTASRVP